jgi:hypothetical protein
MSEEVGCFFLVKKIGMCVGLFALRGEHGV